MALDIKAAEDITLKPTIIVFGVGGAGGNAVNNMIRANLRGAEFVVANTDAQALKFSECQNKIQLGTASTKGLGAGAMPELGKTAAQESETAINSYLENCNMVFITAGMGGGTGTGAAPVIAKLAKELGILTVGVVTKPFLFEGGKRMKIAEAGVIELQKYVDTLIVIPNQNLFRVANENTTFQQAFELADEVLHAGVRGITDLITSPGLVNLDFADIETIMGEKGKAMMGTGEASGEERAIKAAEAAIANPLLDQSSMFGASGVLINITGGKDMTLYEVDGAANRIREEVGNPEANIIFGSTYNPELEGKIRVSVVATGIDQSEYNYISSYNENKLNTDNTNIANNFDTESDMDSPALFNEYESSDNLENDGLNANQNNKFDWNSDEEFELEENKNSKLMSEVDYNSNNQQVKKPSLLKRMWNSLKSSDEDDSKLNNISEFSNNPSINKNNVNQFAELF